MSRLHYWTCRRCGTQNARIKQRCTRVLCEGRRPPKRAPAHRRILDTHNYAAFDALNHRLHGVAHDACGVCGKLPKQGHNDRDHDHRTGNPRGLACRGNSGCNALMPPHLTAARAQQIADYLRRVENHYAGTVA